MKNPQLSTVVSSLTNVVNLVNSARPAWWRCNTSMSPSSPGRGYKGKTVNWPSDKDDRQMFYFNQNAVEKNSAIDLKQLSGDRSCSEDNDMDTSEAELDMDTPVLKKRRRITKDVDSSGETLSTDNTCQKLSNEEGCLSKDKEPTIKLKQIPRSPTPVDSQITSQATIQYEIENFSTESIFANEKSGTPHELFPSNGTPTTLNQSCAIPDSSPNVSPIPMIDSQHTEAIPPTPSCITNGQKMATNGTSAINCIVNAEEEKKDSTLEEHQDSTRKMNNESQQMENQPFTNQLDAEIGEKEHLQPAPCSGQKVTPPSDSPQRRKSSSTMDTRQCRSKSVIPSENLDAAKKGERKSKNIVNGTVLDATKDNEAPLIFLLPSKSALTAADNRIIQKSLKNKRFRLLQSGDCHELDLNFNFNFDCESDTAAFLSVLYKKAEGAFSVPAEVHYVLCFNAEYQTCDGYIIPRSFRYLLAVACGLTIVDFSFLRKASSISSRKKAVPDYLYAPGCAKSVEVSTKKSSRSRGRKEEEVEDNYYVAGDVESVELMGPKRSREQLLARMSNCTSCSYNNGLLSEYSIFLLGDFDKAPLSKQEKRKRSAPTNADANDFDLYTRGRVQILLTLCGALIINNVNGNHDGLQMTGKTVVVLTRGRPKANDMKSAKSSLRKAGISDDKIQNVAVVGLKWLQDSIAEFKVKDLVGYGNQ